MSFNGLEEVVAPGGCRGAEPGRGAAGSAAHGLGSRALGAGRRAVEAAGRPGRGVPPGEAHANSLMALI